MICKRFRVVVVSKYLDGPRHMRAIPAYAVADRERANRCVSRKYDTETAAQVEADQRNAEYPEELDDTCVLCDADEPHEH